MKHIWEIVLAWGRQDPPRAAVIVSILYTSLIAVITFLKNQFQTRENYELDTLVRNGFANDHTKIKCPLFGQLYISKPNKPSATFNQHIGFIAEIFKDESIIGCRAKGDRIYFDRATFKQSKYSLKNNSQTHPIFLDQDGNVFQPKDNTTIVRVKSGGGKTSLLRAYILSFVERYPNGIVVVSDHHGSFTSLRGCARVREFDSSSQLGKQGLCQILKDVRDYQRTIELGDFETLSEAWKKGFLLDKVPWLIVVDEMLESFSNSSSKEESYALNQEILKHLQMLIKSSRKYEQFVVIATQAQLVSQLQIHPNLFHAGIYGHALEDSTSLQGLPLNLPILKQIGVFYYSSKSMGSIFIKTKFVSKEELKKRLGGFL